MSLLEALHRLIGGRKATPSSERGSTGSHQCPQESDLLQYINGHLSARPREHLENHLAECDDCREVLALYAQISRDQEPREAALSEALVQNQAASIMAYIKQDEFKQSQQAARKRPRLIPSRAFGYAAAAAAVVIAVAVGVALFVSGGRESQDAGMQALAQAVKSERRIEPRVSGDLPWSRFESVRGDIKRDDESETSDLKFELAMSQLESAEKPGAPAAARHNLARVYLSRAKYGDADRARNILEQLIASGNDSAEILNDAGVAYMLLGRFEEATDAFSKAIAKSQHDPSVALFNKGLAEYRAGSYVRAQQDWRRFIEVSKDPHWKQEAETYLKEIEQSLQAKPDA